MKAVVWICMLVTALVAHNDEQNSESFLSKAQWVFVGAIGVFAALNSLCVSVVYQLYQRSGSQHIKSARFLIVFYLDSIFLFWSYFFFTVCSPLFPPDGLELVGRQGRFQARFCASCLSKFMFSTS